MSYTKGPWFEHENTGVIIGNDGGTQICDTGLAYWDNLAAAAGQSNDKDFAKNAKATCRANAVLISAAPDLLAACEDVIGSGSKLPKWIVNELSAAIAKATRKE